MVIAWAMLFGRSSDDYKSFSADAQNSLLVQKAFYNKDAANRLFLCNGSKDTDEIEKLCNTGEFFPYLDFPISQLLCDVGAS